MRRGESEMIEMDVDNDMEHAVGRKIIWRLQE